MKNCQKCEFYLKNTSSKFNKSTDACWLGVCGDKKKCDKEYIIYGTLPCSYARRLSGVPRFPLKINPLVSFFSLSCYVFFKRADLLPDQTPRTWTWFLPGQFYFFLFHVQMRSTNRSMAHRIMGTTYSYAALLMYVAYVYLPGCSCGLPYVEHKDRLYPARGSRLGCPNDGHDEDLRTTSSPLLRGQLIFHPVTVLNNREDYALGWSLTTLILGISFFCKIIFYKLKLRTYKIDENVKKWRTFVDVTWSSMFLFLTRFVIFFCNCLWVNHSSYFEGMIFLWCLRLQLVVPITKNLITNRGLKVEKKNFFFQKQTIFFSDILGVNITMVETVLNKT